MRTYREALKRELEGRMHINPRYSLRAFARDLGLPPSRLSEVLSGRCGISPTRAQRIAELLGWTSNERNFFYAQVESEHAKSPQKKKQARIRLKEMSKLPAFQGLGEERFALVSDWQHYALLELTYLKSFQPSATWIARRLGITPFEVKEAVARLLKFGLLKEENGTLKCTQDFIFDDSIVPSSEIRKHHRQLLEKAQAALELQRVGERESLSLTFSLDPKVLPQMRACVERFRAEIAQIAETGGDKERVYALTLQLFGLDAADVAPNRVQSSPNKGVSP